MKKIQIYLFSLSALAVIALFYSCSKDDIKLQEQEVNFHPKNLVQISPGDLIAKYDGNGNIIFIADQQDIISYLEGEMGEEGKLYALTNVAIEQHAVENGNPGETAFVLIGANVDFSIKTGTTVEYSTARQGFYISSGASGSTITCKSLCSYGCSPVTSKNPKTGKKELTCSSCNSGKNCLKEISL